MSTLENLPLWADALIAVLLLISAFTALVGSFALVRFADFYKRIHGPTKATTLGVGGVLIASCIYFSVRGAGFSVHEFLITLFLFLTAPISAHLLVKAAMHVARDRTGPEQGAKPAEP
jgi:multicomponent K+:H+ antiporter subunit G